MNNKVFKYISNISLLGGLAAGGYALVRIYLLRAALPPGTCPVVSFSGFLYTGIALCIVSFVFSLLESRAKKKASPEEKNIDGDNA